MSRSSTVVSGTVDSPIANRGCTPCSSSSTSRPFAARIAPSSVPPIPVPRIATSYVVSASERMRGSPGQEMSERAVANAVHQLGVEHVVEHRRSVHREIAAELRETAAKLLGIAHDLIDRALAEGVETHLDGLPQHRLRSGEREPLPEREAQI